MFGIAALQGWDLATGKLAWSRHADLVARDRWRSRGYERVHLADGVVLTSYGQGDEAELLLLDVGTGEVRGRVGLPDADIDDRAPVRVTDHSVLFVACREGGITLWGLDLVELEFTAMATADVDRLRDARALPRRGGLVTLAGSEVCWFEPTAGEPEHRFELATVPDCLAVSLDERKIVVGDDDGAVHFLRVG